MNFKNYRKIKPTNARLLTQEDYEHYGGIIETNEGPCKFKVGDYLARDTKGIWPIRAHNIAANYTRVSEPDAEGFADYANHSVRQAVKMHDAFTVASGLQGKAGDCLVRNIDGGEWPVDAELFEATYIEIEG